MDLTVKSTAGSFSDRWNRSVRARRVLDDALKYFNLSRGAGVAYVLKLSRTGADLALDEKLSDLGLRDDDVIVLQVSQAKDGSCTRSTSPTS